jgi:parallel beta-helix repeat protein
MNKAKFVKISLLLTALSLSIIIPAIVVTAKKQGYYRSVHVYINDAVPGMSWMDWSAEPWLKGSGTEEDPYMIKDLVIEVSGSQFAMMIHESDAYFKIMKCTFSNDGIEGESAGLVLANTKNGVIFKNRFINNRGAGIALIETMNNTIQKNLCSKNGVGIYIKWGMYTTIKQNDCNNNFDSGIVIASAHKNIIEKNDCFENAKAGIALINVDEPDNSPKDNIIYANNLENNQLGIYLNNADINDILRNTILENFYGILFDFGSKENTVYHNNIIDNSVQAFDLQPLMNNWHHPYMEEGNFWSDTSYGHDEYPFVEKNGWEFMTPIEEEILGPLSNRLGGNRDVYADETSYIRYGVMQLFSERINGEAYPPYTVRINGTEVLDFVWAFQEETSWGEPGLMQLYYIKFPPYYLTEVMHWTLGYHEYQVEISWYDSGVLQVMSFTTSFTLI